MSLPPPRKPIGQRTGPPPRRTFSKPVAVGQASLFDLPPNWAEDWKGMPEFICEDLTAWKSITVNFASLNDLQAFARLIGQTVTTETRSLWFPKAEIDHTVHLQYIDSKESSKKHYFEWKRAGRVLTKDVPLTLPPEIEARVIAYEGLERLLEEEAA
jgi:hypothetical protein